MIYLRSILVGSIAIAISTVSPVAGWGEISGQSPEHQSRALSLNYSLATQGGHPNVAIHTSSTLSQPKKLRQYQNYFSRILNTQSASSTPIQLLNEQRLIPASVTINEDVPSYINHVPSSHEDHSTSKQTTDPAIALEQQTNNSENTDLQDQSSHTALDLSPLNPAQQNSAPSFSRFDWPSFSYNRQLFSQEDSSQILSPFTLEATPIGLSHGNLTLPRFYKVFHADWAPADPNSVPQYGTIPLVINDAVAKNLRYFSNGIADRFQSYLDRFHHYREVVEPIFQEFGIPTELMYLSLVESGFNPKAFSRARASGPWQFMKATGRMYKLNVSWYIDERRDPIKSTVAAAHHLRDLYDRFGSWPLALAAYNAGSGKVSRAIRKTGSRDFWKIRRTWYIRRETKDYVPRFIAATLIATNPTAYGFLAPDGDRHEFEETLITKPVQLAAITKQTGISFEELKRLNPELRRNIVPKSKGPGYHLKVPIGTASLVAAQQATFPVWTQPPPPPTQWYRVRRGDSLSVVARRFRMKVRQLKRMNNLSSNLIRVGKRLRVRGADEDYADDQILWYRVRYGDSLGRIASRFGTSVRKIKQLNKLSTHLIYPGDRLRVKGSLPTKKSPTGVSKWYRVQRGDSLWSIAQQFRVSVRDLRALNNLSTSIIRAGKMLMVSQ